MFEGYGVFGTTELWNNLRVYNYQMRGCIQDGTVHTVKPGCETLPLLVSAPPGDTYSTPQTDSAPWYDSAYPESADFAGFWCESITGFDTLGSREVSPTPFGSIASRRNLTPKTLTVTGWIGGKTCCATQYGYRWLLKTLMERDCDTGEEVSQLSIYDCCPSAEEAGELTDNELIEKYLRIGYRVKVGRDPVILERLGTCCENDCGSTNLYVQFTLVLENPKLYRNISLCAEQEPWPEDIECVDRTCDPCPVEDTVEIQVVKQKTRYPIAVKADGTFCPLGWIVDPLNFPPDDGWIDIVDVEDTQRVYQIVVNYDYSWNSVGWDPTEVDFCDINIEIAATVSSTSPPTPLPDNTTDLGATKRQLPIDLTALSSTGGTWVEDGWTLDVSQPLPPFYGQLTVNTDCGCDDVDVTDCEINVFSDLTWEAYGFNFTGILLPVGCTDLRVRRQYPGTYVTVEEVPISEAFSGMRGITPPTPYTAIDTAYCQPLEWVQACCKIEFTSGIERAEPYVEFFSGSDILYNFKAEFYALESADDVCLCDLTDPVEIAAWKCREPNYAVQFGRSIPAESTIVYDPRDQTIKVHIDNMTYDASSLASSSTGGTPYFVELPDCYGVCVLITAEVHEGELPAEDSYFSVGHIPFNYVGV